MVPLGFVISSVQVLTLHVVPPAAHPQAFPAPSVVALQASNDVRLYDVHGVATTQIVPLKAQLLI